MGDVVRGLRHGRGVQTFGDKNATVYDGEWREGMRHGFGRLSFDAAGAAHYEGWWADDKKSGKGRMVYASGNWYYGDWVADVKHGRGRMMWITAGESYHGDWADGKPHGEGKHEWERSGDGEDGAWFNTRNQYEGGFRAGMRHGKGVFLYATGARYEGHWVDNVKHGAGVYTFEDASEFKGTFARDRAVVKEGGAPFGPTKHLKLDVDDLVDEEMACKALTEVNLDHLLLRYNSELRAIYRKHAVAAARASGCLPENPNKAVPLSVPGFIALMRLSGVAAPDFTVSTIAKVILPAWLKPEPELPPPEEDALAAAAEEAAPGGDGDRGETKEEDATTVAAESSITPVPDALDPKATLLYRQFAEALVRAAHVKFHNLPGLDRRVNKLITEHLLPGEEPGALESLPWDVAVASEEVKAAMRGRVQGLFGAVAREEAKPPTVTARAFLGLLKRAGALSDGEPSGTPVVLTPPAAAAAEDGSEETTREEEEGSRSHAEDGAEGGEDGEAAEAAAAEAEAAGPSLSTLDALAAFTAALGPAAALAEAEAEAEAEAAQARAAYEAGEERSEEEAAAAVAAKMDAKMTTLLQSLDCQATYPEFVEVFARCADVALKGDAPLDAKISVFLWERLKV